MVPHIQSKYAGIVERASIVSGKCVWNQSGIFDEELSMENQVRGKMKTTCFQNEKNQPDQIFPRQL